MGLFTPKITPSQMEHVKDVLNQLRSTANIINTTTKPNVFFGRLHFSLDMLLELQKFEKYKIFKPKTPTDDFNGILENIGLTVDNFIDRAISDNQKRLNSLKTEAARKRNYEKFVIAMISAFDCADTFWSGNHISPHYTGILFTPENYARVKKLYDELDMN